MSQARKKAEQADPTVARGNLTWVEHEPVTLGYPELAHGFGTKLGAGRRARAKIDFSDPPEGGDAKPLKQNLTDLAKDLGIAQERVVYPRQEHGARVLVIRQDEMPESLEGLREERADALITDVPNLALAIRTADCIPILLYDHRAGVIAAVHAGWRSTVAGILEKTLKIMAKEFNTEGSVLVAAIGPGIGFDSFEIEEPVLSKFRERFDFWSRFARPTRNNRWLMDLKMINAYILASTGMPEKNLLLSPLCTVQENELFYSYRREGDGAGRMLNFIMRREEAQKS